RSPGSSQLHRSPSIAAPRKAPAKKPPTAPIEMYATRLAALRLAFVGAAGEPTACDAVARNVIVAGNARVACAIAALDSAFVFDDGADLIPPRSSAKTGAVPANTPLRAA